MSSSGPFWPERRVVPDSRRASWPVSVLSPQPAARSRHSHGHSDPGSALTPVPRCPVPDRNPFLRELLITFGASGYVALYEIEDELTITILAVRHPRENDYH